MKNEISFFEEYGYLQDRENRLREIGNGRQNSIASEAANQIKHLKDSLRELVSITKIHSKRTGNNFAWAEIEEAEKALNQ
jgi:hypothetical protein